MTPSSDEMRRLHHAGGYAIDARGAILSGGSSSRVDATARA